MSPGLTEIAAEDLSGARIVPMDQADAETLAGWSYPGEYAFYDFAADGDDLAELLDPRVRSGRYFAVQIDPWGLTGFVELTPAADGAVELGLGLAPECTGRGLGFTFVGRVCEWARSRSPETDLVLQVAAFNTRAVTVYERVGFVVTGRASVSTNGGVEPFVVMTLGAVPQSPVPVLRFAPLTAADADAIVTWRYFEEYAVYDPDPDERERLLDPANDFLSIRTTESNEELLGYVCVGIEARVPGMSRAPDPGLVDVGLGLRPDRTGRGASATVLPAVLAHLERRRAPAPTRFRAAVAEWNRRARTATQHAGFTEVGRVVNDNGAYLIFERGYPSLISSSSAGNAGPAAGAGEPRKKPCP